VKSRESDRVRFLSRTLPRAVFISFRDIGWLRPIVFPSMETDFMAGKPTKGELVAYVIS